MIRSRIMFLILFAVLLIGTASIACAAEPTDSQRTITNRNVSLPTLDEFLRIVLMRDYNTRVVLLGTTLLGCAAGMVGSFTLLRKRALIGDALSHATLPGIGLAFVFATVLGADGKSLPILLLGATLSGLLGVAAILAICNLTRLKEDTALGAILSVFFGAGVAVLGVVQNMKDGNAAGLESFIYGKTASMGASDATLIGTAALVCVVGCGLIFKELKLLCFDEEFAGSRGFPRLWLDLALMAMVVAVCIVGLQAVGLVLVIALLVIPAAAARFWTERMREMVIISAVLGALGGFFGATSSGLFSNLPSGAMIVLVCTTFFFISMIFGIKRGILVRVLRRYRLNRSVDHQHLLRAVFELDESSPERQSNKPVSRRDLLTKRSWSPKRLNVAIRRAQHSGLVMKVGEAVQLTEAGWIEASRLTRQHRLWELYLITHADIAPSRVDRDADAIEHVLERNLVDELERLLDRRDAELPASPHELQSPSDTPDKLVESN